MQTPVDNVQPQQQNTIPDFIRKLQSMIDSFPEVISFSEDGTEVHIHDHQKFVSELLPRFFRHRKWRSFIRQMNMYNFRKLNRGVRTFIFLNPLFWRGNQDNFSKIKRKINTKQQELQAQNNLQLELKTLLGLQCQNIGIPNCQQLCYQIPTSSLATLPSLKGPLPIIPNPISGPLHQPSYSNSLTHFITSLLNNRRNTENLCHQIRQNMEIISKQRKNTQCKNILNTIKDSMQMIEEVSNKLRQKMQMYVDDRQAAYSQEQPDFSDNLGNYIARNSMLNLGATQKKQKKQEPGRQVNQIPQMVSFSSASSINLIIPQPIIGVRMGLDNGMSRPQVLNQHYAHQNNVEQTGNNNIFMPIATTFNNMSINGSGNGNGYSLGTISSNEGRRSNGIAGQNYNNNNSIFGLKSQSSFTCLINFDKDQKYY